MDTKIKFMGDLSLLFETVILKKLEILLRNHPYIVCSVFLITAPICVVMAVFICTCIIVLPLSAFIL